MGCSIFVVHMMSTESLHLITMAKRKRIDKKYEKVVLGQDEIVTGIDRIDKSIEGGYKRGEIIVVRGSRRDSFSHFFEKQMQLYKDGKKD